MTRGRTLKGRGRERAGSVRLAARQLLSGDDQGDPIRIDGSAIGANGDRWIEPFLRANAAHLDRLELTREVGTRDGVHVNLKPAGRIGAVPLLSPSTRRVVAGLLVRPRFRWASLGAVFESTGFGVEPALGGAPLVPGSAREVPPWLIAGPVLGRLESLLLHKKRAFVERQEQRVSPRGRIEWEKWAREDVARGAWARLPCVFSEPDDDPELLANLRWTLGRLSDSLAPLAAERVARRLLDRIQGVLAAVGPGAGRRPILGPLLQESAWLLEAREAMGWVAEERGLGGSRELDGLCWDLSVDQVWEAWVDSFVAHLAPRLGLAHVPRGATRHILHWQCGRRSMGALVPDVVLRGNDRVVWLDAKYKAHHALLASRGWQGLGEEVRVAHRADLHQALAYSTLADVSRVDTVLAYPELASERRNGDVSIATLASGRRRVRLILVGLPFGFRSPEARETRLAEWRELLIA